MKYTVLYRASVKRDMRRLDAGIARRVDAAIFALAENPNPPAALNSQVNLIRGAFVLEITA